MPGKRVSEDLWLQVSGLSKRVAILEGITNAASEVSELAGEHSHDGAGEDSTVVGGVAEAGFGVPVATGNQSVALGDYARAPLQSSLAIGSAADETKGTNALGEWSIAIGSANPTYGSGRIGGFAGGDFSMAIGQNAYVHPFATSFASISDFSMAVGPFAYVEGDFAIALGIDAVVTEDVALALGDFAWASGFSSIAIGDGARASFGSSLEEGSAHTIAIGTSAFAGGNYQFGSTDGDDAIAIGRSAQASDQFDIAIGSDASAFAFGGVAIGQATIAGELYAISVGYSADANLEYGIAIGAFALADAYGAVALGGDSFARNQYSLALGTQADASDDRSVAIGYSANTTAADQIMLGAATHQVHIPGTLKIPTGAVVNYVWTSDAAGVGSWQPASSGIDYAEAADLSVIDIGDAADAGVSTEVPRADHQHAFPAPAASYPIDVDLSAEADGTATTAARSDHKHHVTAPTVGYPLDVAAVEDDGIDDAPARSDHVHGHGSGYLPEAHHATLHTESEHTTAIRVSDEGVDQGAIRVVDVVGTGIVATVVGDTATITFTGAGGTGHVIQEDGSDLAARTNLNFGLGLLATDDAGNDQTDVNLALDIRQETVSQGSVTTALDFIGADVSVAAGVATVDITPASGYDMFGYVGGYSYR